MILRKIAVALLMVIAPVCLFAQPADLVLNNGNIITIKQKGDRAQVIAIKNHIILALGSNDEIKKYIGSNTKVNDLDGRTATPGFNELCKLA